MGRAGKSFEEGYGGPVTTPARTEQEAECIRRILAGEKHLFHALIRPSERAIYVMLLGMLGSEAEAEDAAQETAIKVFLNLKNFRGDSQFRTWVLSIARNEGLGRLRKIGSRKEDSLDAEAEDQGGDFTPAFLTSWREVPAEALERKELAGILREAIAKLPDIYRNVVILRDIEEMEGKEAAAVLGITEGALKVRLHRARALLQRWLAPRLEGFAARPAAAKRKGFFGWKR
ncbi:MAG TPA: sigma-70 family RNA polymerase sigma factor [Terracidiphilus sp.]|nr:sigma-70 family RNA polymerase sigma factor [Terracidiphilus sp.]